MRATVVVPMIVLGLAACGGGSDAGSGDSRATIDADLTVRVTLGEGGAGPSREGTLRCEGAKASATGFLAGRETEACRAIADNKGRLIQGRPQDQICTEIYGGPERASVTGTLDGKRVDATFDRSNGCGISEWQQFETVLGVAGGGPEPIPGG